MTSVLRDACETIKQRSVMRKWSLPEESVMQTTAESLGVSILAEEIRRTPRDFNVIAQELIDKHNSEEDYTNTDYKNAAWCLWQTDPALSLHKEIFSKIIEKLSTSSNRRLFNNYAASYIQSFDQSNTQLIQLSQVLQNQAYQWGNPWLTLEQNYAFFNVQKGPILLAQAALSQKNSIVDLLSEHGLPASDSESGYVRMVTARTLKNIAQSRDIDHLDRLQMIESFALTDKQKLRFEGQGELVASALIKPFQGYTPEKAVKDQYLNLILALFSDPRLHPERWTYMQDLARIICGWLTEQSLRQFLDIVDEIALERMWKYRRAFWEAVYDEGLISEAWVVLDNAGADIAKRNYGKDVSFATFYKGGSKKIQRGHAVLIMRIGNSIVADWSHNGRCNIWYDFNSEDAPKMYKQGYVSNELVIGNFDYFDSRHFIQTHQHSEKYSWQKKVADVIFKMTNCRIAEYRYRIS